ncbi:MAG: tetratricopeptide repeat protein [Acidobacteria bacterium]|nr:tetratricopeptide repeat protein [Acidobacteriota bacterium]
MALGFRFDKAKVLQTAEKYALQGKISAAIEEYKKILKKDPSDLMTLNTVGDLYLRAGQNQEAVQCFQTLAEQYVEQGFLPRAIAVYKRITKVDPQAAPVLLKLGELYSMQGLLRDSRTHYLQAVEFYLRRQEKEKAREIFEKVLLLDMENPRLQVQMAELYAATGKREEAIVTYLGAVERFLNANEPNEASAALEELHKLDPQNPEANEMRGRLCLERGEYNKAVATLEAIPSWESRKGAVNALFHAYMKQANLAEAQQVAALLFERHEDFAGLAQISESLLSGGDLEGAFSIHQGAADRLIAQGATSDLIQGVQRILAQEPAHMGALDLLWNIHRQSGHRGETEETGNLLGHAYVMHGELEKAREVYMELVALEPDNREYVLLLRQVEARLEGREVPTEVSLEAATAMVSESVLSEAPSTEAVEDLPPREKELVKNCLTEAEIYITYHQISKAIEVLEGGLAQVPGNITLLEQMLSLHAQSQQYDKAAQCAESLTEAYVTLGDGERASRYGELTVTYQQKALEVESQPPSEVGAAVETEPAAYAPAPEPAAAEESQVREVDLSMEWAALTTGAEQPASPPTPAASTIEEIEFYLQAGLASEAAAALDRLREHEPSHPALGDLEQRLAALQGAPEAAPTPAASEPIPVTEESLAPTETEEVPVETEEAVASLDLSASLAPEPAPAEWAAPPPPEPPAPEPTPAEVEPFLSDVLTPLGTSAAAGGGFELSLEEAPRAAPPAATPPSPQDQFAALTEELAQALPEAGASPTPEPAAVAPSPEPSGAKPGGEGLLEDLFAEFKEEMEEPAGTEDLETHYNMGVAFKEMALYDEAIGEFQKVHKIAEKNKDYSHLVQCCSLLATCFLEKGLPQLAVKWYQTALAAPGLDPESSLALLYEMASAYEVAGDRQAALHNFMEVYARNIDYRNVAERIHDLKQGS